jgi:hypothetical protein
MAGNIVLGVYVLLPLLLWRSVYIIFVKRRWHRRESRPWWVLPAGNVLIFVSLLSIVLPVGEVYYRFVYDTTDDFAKSRVMVDWYAKHYHLNKMGVRDSVTSYSQKFTPGLRRVSFIGDSFTVGLGVADVEDRFANLIRKTHLDWQVHLLAQDGRDIDEHIGGVRALASMGYDMDIMVLVYCLNDIDDLIEPWQEKLKQLYAHPTPFVIRQSYLLDTLYNRWKIATDSELHDYDGLLVDAYNDSHWRIQQARLRELRDIVVSGGGRFVVVTFPFMHHMGPDNPFREVHEKLDAFWSQLGTPHLDLLPVFSSHASQTLVVNQRDPHPNEKAHALAAAAVEKFVGKQMQ